MRPVGEIQKLRVRARRSRGSGFDQPIVSDVADAEALARGIAEQLATASPEEALLCLATLCEVQAVLEARLAKLEAEMADTRRQLAGARSGAKACLSYGAAAGRSGGRNGA